MYAPARAVTDGSGNHRTLTANVSINYQEMYQRARTVNELIPHKWFKGTLSELLADNNGNIKGDHNYNLLATHIKQLGADDDSLIEYGSSGTVRVITIRLNDRYPFNVKQYRSKGNKLFYNKNFSKQSTRLS